MKTVTLPVAGMMVLGLAACGGGGSDEPVDDFVVSSGILELELPTEAERADLSMELNDAIDAIELANETGTEVTPSGSASYSGVFGLGVDNDYGTLVTGTVTATFDIGDGGMDVTLTATDVDDDEATSISGSMTATDMLVTGGLYNGTATGTFTVDGSEAVDVSADLDGATISGETFGSFEGIATNPDTSTDTFGGLFYAAD